MHLDFFDFGYLAIRYPDKDDAYLFANSDLMIKSKATLVPVKGLRSIKVMMKYLQLLQYHKLYKNYVWRVEWATFQELGRRIYESYYFRC
jgi:hypothetical protein